MDPGLLMAALTALNLYPRQTGQMIYFGQGESYDTRTGQAQLAQGRDANEIKRTYSNEIVKSQARKFGWTLKQTAPFKYEIVKR